MSFANPNAFWMLLALPLLALLWFVASRKARGGMGIHLLIGAATGGVYAGASLAPESSS